MRRQYYFAFVGSSAVASYHSAVPQLLSSFPFLLPPSPFLALLASANCAAVGVVVLVVVDVSIAIV